MLSAWELECAARRHYERDNFPASSNPAYLKGWAEKMLEEFGCPEDVGLFMATQVLRGYRIYNPFPKGSDEERRFSIALVDYLTNKH